MEYQQALINAQVNQKSKIGQAQFKVYDKMGAIPVRDNLYAGYDKELSKVMFQDGKYLFFLYRYFV